MRQSLNHSALLPLCPAGMDVDPWPKGLESNSIDTNPFTLLGIESVFQHND